MIRLVAIFSFFAFVSGAFTFRTKASDDMYKVMYNNAIRFLNTEFSASTLKLLRQNCAAEANQLDSTFFTGINISAVKIENTVGPAFCDLVTRKYSFAEPCGKLSARDAHELDIVRDSISRKAEQFKQSRKNNSSHNYIQAISNKKEIGMVAFFSSIEAQTMSVEVMSFCAPYSKAKWQGQTNYYYIVFDKSGSIVEVFRGSRYFD